ncbi:MAG TPA: peptidoglycan DD-metalloendopeptidase family protein [Aestuariivirgaceae bacterium]|nr:peptidoglycan DD-metalloendopeptidase family protein [Aestuariivirgaceae bacterium]
MTMLTIQCSRYRGRVRLALLAATALTLAACSGSVERFADFSDVSTSSLPAEQSAVDAGAVDTGAVVTGAPLPQPGERPAWQNAPVDHNADRGMASGTIVVAPGQTLYSIARANDLSPDELAAANSIAPPYALRVGQTLTVPGRSNPVSPSARIEPETIEAANAPSNRPQFGQGETHVVGPGETLFAVGRAYRIDPFIIAEYNRLPEPYGLKVGQTLRIPAAEPTMARRDGKPMTLDQQMADRQQQASEAETQSKALAPDRTAAWQPSNQSQLQDPVAATFRWPVQGRIISTFGQKPTGMRNEGINIAVPEGTSVRAAGSGIVAYAGNELKGYGNLVLIRHDDGWVTAYAHNKELLVSRGDTVKRGDVIASAGQTGSVTSPQVHFEVRKGATAVDPMKHLDTAQAMN